MTNEELIGALQRLKEWMVSVSTGGPRIDDVNHDYKVIFSAVSEALNERGIENSLPYGDLWQWYSRWSSGDFPTYQSRRIFVSEIFSPLIEAVRTGNRITPQPTGWARVDRNIGKIRTTLTAARDAEDFQNVGLQCREALISVAQEVFDPDHHPTLDGTEASATDFKRMVGAYIEAELQGSSNEELRKYMRTVFDLALKLQHQRTATFLPAALCADAVITAINAIAIIAGRRNP